MTVKKSVTIELIARSAGCSPSTVSRVLCGYRKGFSVRPELEEKILQLTRELNYKPNPYWRSLRTKKTGIIAVFDPINCNDGVVQSAKKEFITAIQAAGYTEAGKYADQENPDSYTVTFPVDGALFFDIADGVCLNYVEEKKIPYVVVNGRCRQHGVSLVSDEEANTRILVDYLYSLGHRRIAYYAGHKRVNCEDLHYSVSAREKYYLENLERLGLVQGSSYWKHKITSEEFLKSSRQEGMSAVICYDHQKAVMLMHAAWKLGIRIPEEISIVCYNDEYPLELLNPPVSCIATPGIPMGRKASEILLECIADPEKCNGRVIPMPGKLVIRESARAVN